MSTVHREVALGSFLRITNFIATSVVALLMMPFVVHMLGDRLYGIWILVATFVGYYGLVDLGLSSAVSRYLAAAVGAGDYEECNRVFNTSLALFSALGLVVLLLSGVLAAMGSLFFSSPADASIFWKIILLLGLNLALDFPSRVFTGTLQASLRIPLLAGFEILSLALRTGLVFAVLFAGYKVVAMGWAVLLSGIPANMLGVYYSFKNMPLLRIDPKYCRRDTARSLFSYSIFSFASRIAEILKTQVDGPVVAAFVGLAAVTHYKVASTLIQSFWGLMMAATEALTAVFSRQEGAKDYDALRKVFLFTTKITICMAGFIAFGLVAWSKPFITRWMGPQYLDAYPCLLALVAGRVCALSQTPSIALLYGISKHKFLALFNWIEGLANLGLSLLLVRKYGMVGVALGTMYPMIITKLIIQPVYVCRIAKINYFEYVGKFGKSLAVIAGSLLIPLALTLRFSAPNYKFLFSVGILSAILYGLGLWMFGFSRAETTILKQLIWPRLAVKKTTE